MTCEEACDLMLDRSADAELRAHVAGCPDCAAAQEDMGRIDAWVAPLREVPVPGRLLGRRTGSIARVVPLLVAAAMLVSISLAVVYFKPADPVPVAQEKPAPVGGLTLSSRVEREQFWFREPIRITSTFENVSEHDIVFHKSEDAVIPTMRVIGAGREWTVYVAPGQTMQTEGMVGSLETLKPGAKMAVPLEVKYFTLLDREAPLSLPEGEYTVITSYEKPDNLVEHNLGIFETTRKPVQGLWTGTVKSAPIRFRVGAPRELVAAIETPENGTELRIAFTNAPDAPVVMNGKVKLSVTAKAYGNGVAEFALSDGKQLAPGENWVLPVDLSALTWTWMSPKVEGSFGIGEIAPNGGWVDLAVETDGDPKKTITSPGRLVHWTFNTAPPETLALGLEMKTPLQATLRLTNTSAAPALVNRRLAYASEIAFRLTDPDGIKKAAFSTTGTAPKDLDGLMQRAALDILGPVIVDGLSWSSDALPRRTPLGKADFVALAPGASIESGYNLATLVHDGVPKGRYRLQAVYLNLEPGVRLGLKGAVTGKLTSNQVEVVVP